MALHINVSLFFLARFFYLCGNNVNRKVISPEDQDACNHSSWQRQTDLLCFTYGSLNVRALSGKMALNSPIQASWGSHTPVPWLGAPFQPSPELSLSPHGAVGVWLPSHTTAELTHSLSSPFPQRHLRMLQLPSRPALLLVQEQCLAGEAHKDPSYLLVPGSRELPVLVALPNTCVIINLGGVCIPLSSTEGKFSKQRSQTTHLKQCA